MAERPDAPGALTPSQTVGPFLHLALAEPGWATPVDAADPDVLTLGGEVLDGAGAPVPDAVVETWQYGGPFARCATGADGGWSVRIRRPVGVPTLDGTAQAAHVTVAVFARDRLVAGFDLAATVESWALGFRFDIVLRGPAATPFEEPGDG